MRAIRGILAGWQRMVRLLPRATRADASRNRGITNGVGIARRRAQRSGEFGREGGLRSVLLPPAPHRHQLRHFLDPRLSGPERLGDVVHRVGHDVAE